MKDIFKYGGATERQANNRSRKPKIENKFRLEDKTFLTVEIQEDIRATEEEVRLYVVFNFGNNIHGGASVQRHRSKPTADGPKNQECILGMIPTEEQLCDDAEATQR